MEKDKSVSEIDNEETDQFDYTSDIANLSSALSSLSEIDTGLLNKVRQTKLARMKRLIFDALLYYTEALTEIAKDSEDED